MSGKTWFHIDTATLKDTKLLPELLQENGYVTFGTGKWHNGQPSWLRAFQRGKTVMFGGMSDHTKVPVRDFGPNGKLTDERIGEKFSSELFADSVIEFLRMRNGRSKKPFFAYVVFTAPHDPRQPPLSYREPYYRKLPPLPANFLAQLPFDNGMMQQWQTKVGDTLELPSTNKTPEPIDLTGRPRTSDQWQPDWIVKKYFGDE